MARAESNVFLEKVFAPLSCNIVLLRQVSDLEDHGINLKKNPTLCFQFHLTTVLYFNIYIVTKQLHIKFVMLTEHSSYRD